jgi:hypothetical protein
MAEYSVTGFLPLGNSIAITGATTAPTAIQAPSNASVQTSGSQQFRVVNSGINTLFIGVGASAAEALANAVLITSSQNAIPLLSGSVEILSFPMNSYFTALTASGTSVLYITPGQGL